jgi:hypothetical protein
MVAEGSSHIVHAQNIEELQTKIGKVADTIIDFSKAQRQIGKSIKEQLLEIVADVKSLNVSREEMRKMLVDAFAARGRPMIAGSYLRRLLPAEYKYDTKTRLDYKVKQELKPKSLEEEEGVWTETVMLQSFKNQIPVDITASSKERRIKHIEINKDFMKMLGCS